METLLRVSPRSPNADALGGWMPQLSKVRNETQHIVAFLDSVKVQQLTWDTTEAFSCPLCLETDCYQDMYIYLNKNLLLQIQEMISDKTALEFCSLSSKLQELYYFPPKCRLCKSCHFPPCRDVFLLPPALNCVPAVLGAVILHQRSADYFHLVSLVRKWFWHALTPCFLGINMRAMEKLQTVNK